MNIHNVFKVAMVKEAITEVFEKFFKRRELDWNFRVDKSNVFSNRLSHKSDINNVYTNFTHAPEILLRLRK